MKLHKRRETGKIILQTGEFFERASSGKRQAASWGKRERKLQATIYKRQASRLNSFKLQASSGKPAYKKPL